MRSKLVLVALTLLFALVLIPPAVADTFEAMGSTNALNCDLRACTNLSYDLHIVTDPLATMNVGAMTEDYYLVTSISGTVDGYGSVSMAPSCCAILMTTHGATVFADPIPDGDIALLVNGFSGAVGGGGDIPIVSNNPVDPSHTVRIDVNDSQGIFAYCTWNAVAVPEPSSLLLLGAGLIGLTGAKRFRNRKLQS